MRCERSGFLYFMLACAIGGAALIAARAQQPEPIPDAKTPVPMRGPGSTVEPHAPPAAPAAALRHGKDYALLFAVDDYDHEEWPTLASPLADAQALANELKASFGFSVELMKNPTRGDAVRKLLEYRSRQFAAEDQLLIFFAGHGAVDQTSKEGFLAFRDARSAKSDPHYSSLFETRRLLAYADELSCRHVLVLLDSVAGGIDGERAISDPTLSGIEVDHSQNLPMGTVLEEMSATFRRVLTSGGTEYASAYGAAATSPFTGALLRTLASFAPQGAPAIEFEAFLGALKAAAPPGGKTPVPDYATFGRDELGGEFFFFPARNATR